MKNEYQTLKPHKVFKHKSLWMLLFILYACSCGNNNDMLDKMDDKKEPEEGITRDQNGNSGTVSCPDTTYYIDLYKESDSIDLSDWELAWEDDFDYDDHQLDARWTSQNGPSGHILCSRWRENAAVSNGVLELKAIKESRGGQDWTCGSIWTKEAFGYGYFECKYKYAGASGTNNSFWLFPLMRNASELFCELDVNEGHFPNEVNTNLHHWLNRESENNQLAEARGLSPAYAHTFDSSIVTDRIRFSSNNASHFHIREFRIYEPNAECYPHDLLSANADKEVVGLNNLTTASDVSIEASGVFREEFKVASASDGNPSTSWVSQKEGEKWLTFTWPKQKEIGHIQFINGWQKSSDWLGLISDYKIEAFIDGEWVELAHYDVKENYNYAEEYHVYGMEWNASEISFYFDNQLIRTIPNTRCFDDLHIFLSLAIFEHAGEVTDEIDGKSMKIDWVKYYQRK